MRRGLYYFSDDAVEVAARRTMQENTLLLGAVGAVTVAEHGLSPWLFVSSLRQNVGAKSPIESSVILLS